MKVAQRRKLYITGKFTDRKSNIHAAGAGAGFYFFSIIDEQSVCTENGKSVFCAKIT
jgi:hypothetical protein